MSPLAHPHRRKRSIVYPTLLLSILLLISSSAFALHGDINADGLVNVSDVQCVVLSALDLTPEDPTTNPSCLPPDTTADLDCSESISVVDVQLSVQMVLGALTGATGLPDTIDPDADAVVAGCDLCPETYNPEQLDSDEDGLGDLCDPTPVECGGAPQVTCAGAAAPDWALENLHPETEGYQQVYGLDSYASDVLVVMLLTGS